MSCDENAAAVPPVVFGLSHVDVPVSDISRAGRIYEEALGFRRKCGGEGWAELDASSIAIRLVEAPRSERRAALRIQVADVEASFRRLVDHGARKIYAPARTPQLEVVGSVADLDGNNLSLWRALSEDEYGYLPELPVETEWTPKASSLLKSLLVSVPALFRALARRKVVRVAEELAAGRVVEEIHVVRAYILASAKVTRDRLREPLRKHGYDPEELRADFEAE